MYLLDFITRLIHSNLLGPPLLTYYNQHYNLVSNNSRSIMATSCATSSPRHDTAEADGNKSRRKKLGMIPSKPPLSPMRRANPFQCANIAALTSSLSSCWSPTARQKHASNSSRQEEEQQRTVLFDEDFFWMGVLEGLVGVP